MAQAPPPTRLLAPHRVVGLINDRSTPFAVQKLGDETFACVSLGRHFQIFQVSQQLKVTAVSERTSGPIGALAVRRQDTIVAVGKRIDLWHRLRYSHTIGSHDSPITHLLMMGDHLLSLSEDGCLKVWGLQQIYKGTMSLADRTVGKKKEMRRVREHRRKVRDMSDSEAEEGDEVVPSEDEEQDEEELARLRDTPLFVIENVCPDGSPTTLVHPDTYVNKIVVGSSTGKLYLWNFHRSRLVHTFECVKGASPVTCLAPAPAIDVLAVGRKDGTVSLVNLKVDRSLFKLQADGGAVTSLSFRTDNPSFPMMASGMEDGRVWIWDLQKRTMSSEVGNAPMGAHDAQLISMQFVPNEPLLLSMGADNAIKLWIFDSPEGTARLLRSKEGHSAPPCPRGVRWYGNTTLATMGHGDDATALNMLSAARDRSFRNFHAVRDTLSRELSQGKVISRARKLKVRPNELKLRPVVAMAFTEARSKDWSDIVTAHERDACVYVWQYSSRCLGPHELRQAHWNVSTMGSDQDPRNFATTVAVSICGNFAFVGTKGGAIYKYNMQSGKPRGAFPPSAFHQVKRKRRKDPGNVAMTAKRLKQQINKGRPALEVSKNLGMVEEEAAPEATGHVGESVTGLVIDGLNCTLISTGLDGKVMWWDVKTHALEHTMDLKTPISICEIARDSGLLAVGCDDLVVRVIDIETRSLVRRFPNGHTCPLTDLCFSPDGRRLFTTAHDGSLRVYDLPTGKCIEWVAFSEDAEGNGSDSEDEEDGVRTGAGRMSEATSDSLGPATSVSVSPTGEFICTTHAGDLGLHLWTDKSMYSSVYVDREPAVPSVVSTPHVIRDIRPDHTSEEESSQLMDSLGSHEEEKDPSPAVMTASKLEQKGTVDGEISLSGLPRSHWETLFHLDLVRERNKPTEPVKAPPQAPFFLPTVRGKDGLTPTFQGAPGVTADDQPAEQEEEKEMESWGAAWDDDATAEAAVHEGQPEDALQPQSRLLSHTALISLPRSRLAELLLNDSQAGKSEVLEYLKSLTPSAIDADITSLCRGDHDDEGVDLLSSLLGSFQHALESGHDFDVVQAYLNRTLRVHGDIIMERPELIKASGNLSEYQTAKARQVRELMQKNLCLIQFFCNNTA